ncbi:aminotransferase class V-fold PLP-dependent enzyme, partial [Pseudomonas aeruginosa]|uniref:aminotransferase class V-fold PLP-dependent enzyme n=1 Tax=Pseudomonas aeruginosa TaxID=287 RepID=UPI003D29D56E
VGIVVQAQRDTQGAGHHCAMPLLQRLEVPGALRVSLGLYNDADDLERFFLALDRSLELLR